MRLSATTRQSSVLNGWQENNSSGDSKSSDEFVFTLSKSFSKNNDNEIFQNIILAATVTSVFFLTACDGNKTETAVKEETHEHEEGEAQEVALTADQYNIAGIKTGKVETRPTLPAR